MFISVIRSGVSWRGNYDGMKSSMMAPRHHFGDHHADLFAGGYCLRPHCFCTGRIAGRCEWLPGQPRSNEDGELLPTPSIARSLSDPGANLRARRSDPTPSWRGCCVDFIRAAQHVRARGRRNAQGIRINQPQAARPGGPVSLPHAPGGPVGPLPAVFAPLRYLNERAASIYAGQEECLLLASAEGNQCRCAHLDAHG